ncbi:hypothetical protein [Petrotoga sp. 9PWA.NaAc.5.4]|uniref:DUF6115 domain-containing protein n=1 Tax=Petrotoga sp. 9PWA.NaAc.5.4 TaxID=1434328 RepID=UPI000CBEFCCA|nr:hypothetical protein [Petrotoga sp. 9PWA.NaAc.5.4]PNR97200.1 hypothetical protein X924_00550 [Petrotoga sp. 9PWA.NaAc.5.4]
MVLLYLLVLVSIVISLINIFFLFKFINFVQENQNEKQKDITEEGNIFLARFQKITSTRLRALDNKMELVDQLLKDLDDAYAKTFSLLSDLENKLNEIKMQKVNDQIYNKKPEALKKESNDKIESDYNDKIEENKLTQKRVYELSRELGLASKELIELVNKRTSLNINNHMEKVALEDEKIIREIVANKDLIKEENKTNSPNLGFNLVKDNTTNYPKKDRIVELHKKGLSPQEIGKELKIGIGEVMLVLNLFNAEEKQG